VLAVATLAYTALISFEVAMHISAAPGFGGVLHTVFDLRVQVPNAAAGTAALSTYMPASLHDGGYES
jgi:hypothetical protein